MAKVELDTVNKKVKTIDENVIFEAVIPDTCERLVGLIKPFSGFINLNTVTKSIHIPADAVITTAKARYILSAQDIDLTVEGTSALKVFYSKQNNSFVVKRFDYYPTVDERFDYLLFCEVRCPPEGSGDAGMGINAPYHVDGKMPGYDIKTVCEKDATVLAIAHRGFSSRAPENTLVAFKEAYEEGFRVIETDVQLTSDNEFVLMHDSTVDRTTDGTGSVNSLTLAEIQAFDAGSYAGAYYTGEKVPSLKEALMLCKSLNMIMVIEPKNPFNNANVTEFLDLVREYGMIDSVVLNSASPAHMIHARDNHPDVHLMFLVIGAIDNALIDQAITYKTAQNSVAIGTTAPISLALSSRAHIGGIKVYEATLNNKASALLHIENGGDGVITNKINVAELMIEHHNLSLI